MKKLDEPEFLHSLATPLGTALLLADSLRECFAQSSTVTPSEAAQLDNLIDTLEILRKAVRLRQEQVSNAELLLKPNKVV